MVSVAQMEDVTGVDVVVEGLLYQVLRLISCQLCHPGSSTEERGHNHSQFNLTIQQSKYFKTDHFICLEHVILCICCRRDLLLP